MTGRTLVFCTAYAANAAAWAERYQRWLGAIRASGLRYAQILLVDDGSSAPPAWPEMDMIRAGERTTSRNDLVFYHFPQHLGRQLPMVFPGWYRSFAFAAEWARIGGFDRIVHVESDAFLISQRAVDFVNSTTDGWTAMFCRVHSFPEIAIQIMAGRGVDQYSTYVSGSYDQLTGRSHEWALPVTSVEKRLVGDRYSEYLDYVPYEADWVTQTPLTPPADYFWWLRQGEPSILAGRRASSQTDGSATPDRWGSREPGYAGSASRKPTPSFPGPRFETDHSGRMSASPMTWRTIPLQRVGVYVKRLSRKIRNRWHRLSLHAGGAFFGKRARAGIVRRIGTTAVQNPHGCHTPPAPPG